MYASNYFEEVILNLLCGNSASAPSALYLRLFLTNPTETGASGTEVSYTGYAAQQITFTTPASVSGGIGIYNASQINFPQSSTDAGQVEYIGVFDSATGGNMYLYGQLSEPLTISAGEAPVFLTNEICFYLTGDLSDTYKTKVLNLLNGTSLSGFTPYFALFSGNPNSGGAELTGSNYNRVAITFSSPTQTASGAAQISNSAIVEFNRASTNWGTTNYRAIMESASSGACVWAQAKTAKSISKGRKYSIPVGGLIVGLN